MINTMISIIVPIYNAEKYLRNCVRSVQSQAYENWELLLIDDGSQDSSGAIADELAQEDKKIRVWHKENGGVSSARNFGLEKAVGGYIMFLDADDELINGCLRNMMTLSQETDADIVAGQTSDNSIDLGTGIGYVIWRGDESLRNSLKDNIFTYSACAKVFKRKCIGNTRFLSEIRINEDSYFVFQILAKQPVFMVSDEVVYKYTENPMSASRGGFSEKYFDILRVSNLKYKIVESQYPDLLELAKNMQLKARMNLLRLLALRTGNEYRSLEKEMLVWVMKNKDYYISATESDDKWIFILKNHLYYPYKVIKKLCG